MIMMMVMDDTKNLFEGDDGNDDDGYDGDADDVGQRARIPDLGIADDMPSTGARREVHDDADTIHQ